MQRLPLHVPCREVKFIPKGEQATNYKAGDFLLVTDNSFLAYLIRFGQMMRVFNPRFSRWSHAALITSTDGDLIEAQAFGIKQAHISKYLNKDYIIVHVEASDDDRFEAVNFAKSCLNNPYGYLTFLSIGLSLLTGLKFSFGFSGHEVCSGLVARSLERTTAIFPVDASHIAPANLAEYYIK